MLLHYVKTALRNLLRHRVYTAINVFGLATGLTSCLLIGLFVQHEFSYDASFVAADRIYRLSPHFAASSLGPEREVAGNVAPLIPLLKSHGVEGVEAMARIGNRPALVSHDDQAFHENDFRYADADLFKVFEFTWLQGDAATALTQPASVVLTASTARKYFGSTDVLGKTLLLENAWPLTVTGVIADLPANTHLALSLVTTMDMGWKLQDFDYSRNWAFTNFHSYLRLQPGASAAVVLQRINDVVAASGANIPSFFNINAQAYKLSLLPIAAIHLHSALTDEMKPAGSLAQVVAFASIAICLLLVACINYMNLATARALQRSKEVGVRKVVGSSRSELAVQFLTESLLLSLLALLVALAAVESLLPLFGALIERQLPNAALLQPAFIAFVAGITLATALLAGGYPAFYLSALQPARDLRTSGGATVRNVLVVVQFGLAIALIVATSVVYLQMRHVRRMELGFARDNVIVLQGTDRDGMGAQWQAFRQTLLQHPGVASVTEADMHPDAIGPRKFRQVGSGSDGYDVLAKAVGFGFFDTYGIPLVSGRAFNEQFGTDAFNPPPNVPRGVQPTGAYVISEAAARQFGWTPQQAIGQQLEMDFSSDFSLTVKGSVIGVVKDAHLQSLRNAIQPVIYFAPAPNWGARPSLTRASVRLAPGDTAATLDFIRQQWKRLIPELPFALLTIAIACLGLFGLATYTVERRRKEIGVRKVMGSSVLGIVLLLTNDFSKLVLIANVAAWPVAYYAMNRWLQAFAYRIDLTPLIFLGSGFIALCIAWVTVGGTAAKAANQKPVLALRYE